MFSQGRQSSEFRRGCGYHSDPKKGEHQAQFSSQCNERTNQDSSCQFMIPSASVLCELLAGSRRGKPHSGLELIPAIQYHTASWTLDAQSQCAQWLCHLHRVVCWGNQMTLGILRKHFWKSSASEGSTNESPSDTWCVLNLLPIAVVKCHD